MKETFLSNSLKKWIVLVSITLVVLAFILKISYDY